MNPLRRGASLSEMAAAWVLEERRGLSPQHRAKRDAWLAQSAENRAAYEAACAVYETTGRHAADPQVIALRHAALAARAARRSITIGPIVASFALAAGAIIGWTLLDDRIEPRPSSPLIASAGVVVQSGGARYASEIGERRSVTLPDGSIMELNTASAADVLFTDEERGVRLLRGQALFTVAKGQSAPFRVYAGDRIVTATGTQFDVRIDSDEVRVALVEGHVRVDPRRAGLLSLTLPWESEALAPGDVLVAAIDARARVRVDDVERLTSWRSGVAVFRDTPLSEAVREMNRYTSEPIILANDAIGGYRVSGTFRVGEPDRFARTMTEMFPVDLNETTDGRLVLASRGL